MNIIKYLFFIIVLFPSFSFSQIPGGYYSSADGKAGEELKSALYNIIKNHTVISYSGLWTAFQTTDDKPNGKVWDMYSDIPNSTPPYEYTFITNQCGNYSSEGDCYNREHSFPKSWFNDDSPMYSDLFHLYPTDGYVNNKRGNYPFGNVNSPSWTALNGSKVGPSSTSGYTGVVFEPIDAYKGDFARSYFYMVTRYENLVAGWSSDMLNGSSFPAFSSWAITLLLDWNKLDPVSQKEIDRNNEVYENYQHNRNPFIDHPEYAEMIWGDGINPVQFTSTPILSINIDSYYEYNITATAEPGNTIIISGTQIPSWLTLSNISNGTAKLSGTPNSNSIGIHDVSLTAEDGFSRAQQDFSITVNNPTTISLNEEISEVSLYPNPASDKITIALNHQDFINVKLFNLQGVCIIDIPTSQKTITLDLNGIRKGMYILVIYGKAVIISRKVVLD